jgi:hypothetical protein
VAERVLGVGDGEDFEAVVAKYMRDHVSQEELVLDQQDPRPLCSHIHSPPRSPPTVFIGTQGQRVGAADVQHVSDNWTQYG